MKLKIEIFETVPTRHESSCGGIYTLHRADSVRLSFVREYKTQSFPRALSFARRLIQLHRLPFEASKVSRVP